jgi:FHS family Na+ dependent glucose MFS transporter 1
MTIPITAALPAAARLKRRQATAYYIAFIGLGLTVSSLGPTLPGLADNTESSLSQISIVFTVQALGLLAGNLLSGRWYDRAPGHPYLAAMLLAIALMLVLTPLVSSLAVLAAIMFVIGVGAGSVDVGGNTLMSWVYGDQVGPRMNALHFFFGLGALLAPLFVAQDIAFSGDITWAYWILALLMLPAAVMCLRQPSPKASPVSAEAPGQRPRWLLVILIAAMFFLFVGAELSFGGWIYTYAVSLDLATATTAGYLTSLYWAALTAGRLVSIPLAARIRPRYLLTADIAGMVISLALLLLLADQAGVVWIASFGMGFSMANVFPTLILLGGRHLPVTGNITSWFLVGGSLGSMLVPWLIGQRFEATGPQVTMVIILSTVVLAAGVLAAFLLAVRPSPGREAS